MTNTPQPTSVPAAGPSTAPSRGAEPDQQAASAPAPAPAPLSCSGSALIDVEDLALGVGSSPAPAPAGDGEKKQLHPSVPFYGPCITRSLKPGETKKWCTCGLSKSQPWCDGSHRGTEFKPLVWKVPDTPQTIYDICNCKYTKKPPLCDATHMSCPMDVYKRQKACTGPHTDGVKICSACGWTPGTMLIDL
ncbi:hypothetical protein AMAG_02543 [Allomyces macrogynus ATCC 38327]|uniref:Iron-binding zinc finger CDGSH type domain-containing protein n=1 Tax=Allomyces macrogynus (strain ATCC 38327) TaxID=578462 RepID=A0A0L0S2F5_ALLM3|nr:hypothetical protein AMAG_02543 [Allomyces macrogynus ATCC 38327]|eukprot:KNE56767.1 hypothetical protein AMAG_02543 [Allomyces macrogynus ATCC 38327]